MRKGLNTLKTEKTWQEMHSITHSPRKYGGTSVIQFHASIPNHDAYIVEAIKHCSSDDLSSTDSMGNDLLMICALWGQARSIDALLLRDPTLGDSVNNNKLNALDRCCIGGVARDTIVPQLIQHGLKVSQAGLDAICQSADIDMLAFLITNQYILIDNDLFCAALKSNNLDVIRYVVETIPEEGDTALMLTVKEILTQEISDDIKLQRIDEARDEMILCELSKMAAPLLKANGL
jgi:hypothetical protein